MTNVGQGLRQTRGFSWLLWIALAAVWFATMPLRPLVDPDEGRYAEVPREMAVTGDWITPRLDGLTRANFIEFCERACDCAAQARVGSQRAEDRICSGR